MSPRFASPLALAAVLAGATGARADGPSVWGRARSPDAAHRADLVAEVDSLLERHARSGRELGDSSADPVLREAKRRLDEAGGAKSNDVNVLVRYGEVYDELHDFAGCVRVLELGVKLPAPAPVRAGMYNRLAICHAHLGHQNEEIKNYDAALLLESGTRVRSVLLSNRAESLMAIGDVSGAIAGYREGIALTPDAATTYWGLAVALDRSGSLDGGLESIRIARTYDKNDHDINSPVWFYDPPWDEHWYRALGHWQRAREATQHAAQTEEYLAAVAQWEEYIQRAPGDDRYLPFARVRLKQCEHERDRVLKRRPQSTYVPKKVEPPRVSPSTPLIAPRATTNGPPHLTYPPKPSF